MAENKITLPDAILEKTTPEITAVIKDEDDVAIPDTSLTTLTLTLYNLDDAPIYTVLNSRNAQNVLNANNVVVDGSGNLTWSVQPGDTAIIADTSEVGRDFKEAHRAVFEWTYNAGAKNGKHIIDMKIKNLAKTS